MTNLNLLVKKNMILMEYCKQVIHEKYGDPKSAILDWEGTYSIYWKEEAMGIIK